jgi:hypothetical protein
MAQITCRCQQPFGGVAGETVDGDDVADEAGAANRFAMSAGHHSASGDRSQVSAGRCGPGPQ